MAPPFEELEHGFSVETNFYAVGVDDTEQFRRCLKRRHKGEVNRLVGLPDVRQFYMSTLIKTSNSMVTVEDAVANAVGVLGIAESRVERVATPIVFLFTVAAHRNVGVMTNLMTVVKTKHDNLYCDLLPCFSMNAKFYLNNYFNASNEMLKMSGLYDKRTHVGTPMNAKLTYERGGTWNKEMYIKVMNKFFPGEQHKLLSAEPATDAKHKLLSADTATVRCTRARSS